MVQDGLGFMENGQEKRFMCIKCIYVGNNALLMPDVRRMTRLFQANRNVTFGSIVTIIHCLKVT